MLRVDHDRCGQTVADLRHLALSATHPLSRERFLALHESLVPPLHLLMDSTGLKLCGAGEWLLEKHGTRVRRSWRKLHLGVDAETGQIVASALTSKEADDGVQTDALLDQITDPVASVTVMEPTIRVLFMPPSPHSP